MLTSLKEGASKDASSSSAAGNVPKAGDTERGDVQFGETSGETQIPQQDAPDQLQQQRQPIGDALPEQKPQTQPQRPPDDGVGAAKADPPLARHSAPIAACVSSPNTSRSLTPTPLPPLPHHGSSFHTSSLLPMFRSPGWSTTAELSRRLRGLMTTAVNFRDVELMPQPQPLEGDLGLLEQQEDADADAATGSTSAPVHVSTSSDRLATGATAERFGGSGGGASSGTGGEGSAAGGSSSGGGGDVDGNTAAAAVAAHLAVGGSGATGSTGGRQRTGGAVVRKSKLIIIMVGLPGRGKTFLCNKLCCYLNWLGHATRHFNVGSYRRRQKHADELQSAEFFDHSNEAGLEARNRALMAALDDLTSWLRSDVGQVAVFDATNTTESRRNLLRSKFHGVWQYLFIETICSDPAVLEQNYRNKMQYSPDYTGVEVEQAVADFLARIAKYEEVYEPIADRNLHYIKLIDMVTGRGHMDINRISGYLPGKIVFFLMQVCKAGLTSARRIWLTRHGESEYNQKGLIGGNSSLSERGERYSRALPAALISRLPQDQTVTVAIWTSTLKRTIETARFLPFPKLRWKALDEIDAGICDGMTYEQIAERYPEEYEARKRDKLRYRYPAGESYMDVIQRVEPVIIELERERECVVVVAHQAVLRAVYAYFMNVPPEDIPRLSMPLHTLIELTPMPDGTMSESRFPVDINAPDLGPITAAGCRSGPVTGTEIPPPTLLRSPSGACSGDLVAAAANCSPLSSMNSGISCMGGQELGSGAPAVPASPTPNAPAAAGLVEVGGAAAEQL